MELRSKIVLQIFARSTALFGSQSFLRAASSPLHWCSLPQSFTVGCARRERSRPVLQSYMILHGASLFQPRVDTSGASAARSLPATTSGRSLALTTQVALKTEILRSKSEHLAAHLSPTAVRVLKDEAEQPLIGFGEVVEVADVKSVRVLVKKGQPEVQYLVSWKVLHLPHAAARNQNMLGKASSHADLLSKFPCRMMRRTHGG